MPKYTVQTPLQHDADRYEIGDPIELSAKAAEPLLAAGALALADKKSKAEPEPEAK